MPMNHSIKTDAWIKQVTEANPIRIGADGSLLTCPVRLHYPNLFRPAPPLRGEVPDPNKPGKFGATFLFPPGVEGQINTVLGPVLMNAARAAFPKNFDPATGEVSGLHFPLRNQADKIEHQGFTRGALFFNATSKFAPLVVDTGMNDVTDENLVYPGMWVIAAVNAYTFNDPRKKGVSLGLKMVMLLTGDTRLKSAGADPSKAFEGVKIDSSFSVDDAFGAGQQTGGYVKQETNGTGGLW